MSAFEVDETHIDVLVSAALQRRHGDTLTWYFGDLPTTLPGNALVLASDRAAMAKGRREVTSANAETWGAVLVAENRRSVNHRYAEDEIEAPYVFSDYSASTFKPEAILSALSCYEYQACEHPGWEASEARAFCDALRHRMIRMLPGYSDAPWEVTDASQVTVGRAMKVQRRRSA